jgi:hypothetical protein
MTGVLRMLILSVPVLILLGAATRTGVRAQDLAPSASRVPTATVFLTSPSVVLTGRVDSNSPAFWDRSDGRALLRVFTSFGGVPSVAVGTDVQRLSPAQSVTLTGFDGSAYWMEAVVRDVDGTLYGYYHNEQPATVCREPTKVVPRLGAARSEDQGRTWQNLGIIIEAARATFDCATPNRYFVGGVGDLSVMLDPDSKDLYIFYSEYSRAISGQGIGVARLLWADRDAPVGKASIWRGGIWQLAREVLQMGSDGTTSARLVYPTATPLFPTTDSWHDDNESTDAFWGPSVHWNTYLQQYVMLLNRAKNAAFDQEGIYMSFSPTLDNPDSWTEPERILKGGGWYPQVIGFEAGTGSDKVAGEWARLFITGRSDYVIQFTR